MSRCEASGRTRLTAEPELVEAAVTHMVESDPALFDEYHRQVDPVYELPREGREAEFDKLHQRFFNSLGLAKPLLETVQEFPDIIRDNASGHLRGLVREIVCKRATAAVEETADIQEGKLEIRLLAGRFSRPEELKRFLSHELMHVSDMLDERFQYEPERLKGMPLERFGLLWDTYIDGRLTRAGRKTVASRDERLKELEALYPQLSRQHCQATLDALWEAEKLTHQDLLAMATDPAALFKLVDGAIPEGTGFKLAIENRYEATPLPGSLCPLCRMPNYHWAEEIDKEVESLIQGDFPEWNFQQGICERCLELYNLRAGCW